MSAQAAMPRPSAAASRIDARMRLTAPRCEANGDRIIDAPLFAALSDDREWLLGADIDDLNKLLAARNRDSTAALRFVAQTRELLADGLHYEQRIAERGLIATREDHVHDRFNAGIWLRHAEIKRAMNARQVADIARVGPRQRTRGQCALTHFDEAGAFVWIADDAALAAWDAHDWPGFFVAHGNAWGSRLAVTVIGHALFEHALVHGVMPVAKALAVRADRAEIAARCDAHGTIAAWPEAERAIAREIFAARLLADPQELRPLPLAGIPGWQHGQCAAFYADAPCFRPLRAGRRYPRPLGSAGRPHSADA